MGKQVLYHGLCRKFNQHFLIEAEENNQGIQVINFQDLTDEQAKKVSTPGWKDGLSSMMKLRACAWCGSRTVANCRCCIDHGMCPGRKGEYRFQCLYCNELVPASASGSGARSLKELRISVSTPNFDDIGEILRSMNINYKPFNVTGFDCDVLFLNCGTPDAVNSSKLREFVQKGGCVYMSDWAEQFLREAFPGRANINRSGKTGTMKARVVDRELKDIIGEHIEVMFDLGSWGEISSHKGETLIETATVIGTRTLMFTFKEGKGQVFYTSFHNHAQADEKEKTVLKVMLARQIGAVTEQSTEMVLEDLGLNINIMKQTMGQ